MEFRYRARSAIGEPEEGTLDADTQESAARALVDRGLFPLDIRPSDPHSRDSWWTFRGGRDGELNRSRQALFARQLSDLLLAGVPVVSALSILEQQADDVGIARRCGTLAAAIRQGSSVADALDAIPGTLPSSLTGVVRAGEVSGALDSVITRIAGLLEEEAELASKVREALVYPVLVSIASVLTLGVLFGFLIPRLSVLYADMGQQLPVVTRALLSAAELAQHYGVLVPLVALLTWFIGRSRVRRSKAFAVRVASWVLRVPRLGEMVRQREIVQFTRTLATLVAGGVPVLESLRLTERACGNAAMAQQIASAREHVQQGAPLSSALDAQASFSGPLVTMIEVGERSGDLSTALERAGAFYGRSLQTRLQLFVRFLEPALIFVLAIVVGVIVFAMMLPILELNLGVG